jgi:SAM-dependent methyltransferase
MNSLKTIRIADGEVYIPLEIFLAWRQPFRLLALVEIDGIALRAPSEVRLYSILKRILKRILDRILNRPIGSKVLFLRIDQQNDYAVFSDRSKCMPEGEYLPANYDPMYYLMEITKLQHNDLGIMKATGNSETWAKIENYHEHLSFDSQDVQSHSASKLLVTKIRELNDSPKSILELGCGSGRNLWHLGHAFPEAKFLGIDINPVGVHSGQLPTNVRIQQGDVLQLDWETLGDFDVIFTSGFLMHINHGDVRSVLKSINKHSKYHVHFELHGPSYAWDYHRYPRSYDRLMQSFEKRRSYIFCPLQSQLKKNRTYCFKMFLNLTDSSNFVCNNFGAYFSKDSLTYDSINFITDIIYKHVKKYYNMDIFNDVFASRE